MRYNPFTPEFGVVPEVLAGRDSILRDMRLAFGSPHRDPSLTTIFIGARGTGKTALLACVRDEALAQGWVAASVTALPGMLEELYEQVRYRAGQLLESDGTRRITSLSVGPVSAGWEHNAPASEGWRMRMTRLLDALAQQNTGLLITVDEVDGSLDEMMSLAATYQHFITEGRRVSLVMAGLPHNVNQLLASKSVSFLRRASQRQVGRISDSDVAYALRATAESAGKVFDDQALAQCAHASRGFAYMLQLVGYHAWAQSGEKDVIGAGDARRAVASAREDLRERVLIQTLRDLSAGDVRFLRAMLEDPGDSRVRDIALRMGVSAGYASTYKTRLLAAGVIGERSRGVVGFELPGIRELLAEGKDVA